MLDVFAQTFAWITRRVPNDNDLTLAKFYQNYYEFVGAIYIKQWIMCKVEFDSYPIWKSTDLYEFNIENLNIFMNQWHSLSSHPSPDPE